MHPQGFYCLFGDGTVRMVGYDITPTIFQQAVDRMDNAASQVGN